MAESTQSPNVVFHESTVSREARWAATGSSGATIWLTGLSGSGKSTIAAELERNLLTKGVLAYMLDGDNLRHGLNGDLGFSAEDRAENVRRAGEVARLFADAGAVAIVPLISPYVADRDRVRHRHTESGLRFLEVFVDTPLDECERRDPKGLYKKARAGELPHFTGIDDPYEPPVDPDLTIGPGLAPDAAATLIAALLPGAMMLKRPIWIGAIVAFVLIVAGVVLVIAAGSGNDEASGSGSNAKASAASTTTTSTSTTTTTTAAPPPTTAAVAPPANQPGGTNAGTTPDTLVDPTDPIYPPVPLPPGVSATLDTCAWVPANGGELQASGTVTTISPDEDSWLIDAVWLESGREIDDQSDWFDVNPGQTVPWSLSLSAPAPPPPGTLSCALEIQ